MAKSSEIAEAFRLAGMSMREASHRAARGMFRFGMAWHSGVEVEVEPGLSMLLCRGCAIAPRTPWPCHHYTDAERALAALEAEWARQDSERIAAC